MTALIWIVGVLAALVAAALLLEMLRRWGDARRFPCPGKLYDIGGVRLHARVTGVRRKPDDPIIILDGGLTTNSLAWNEVIPLLTSTHQVLTYDRAGHCWSESGPQPRTAQRECDELRALIRKLHLAPPYIYVAHSYSGFLGRVFAKRTPGVAGLVLVETMSELLVGLLIDKATLSKAAMGVWLARLGILRRMKQAPDDYKAPSAWRAFSMSGKDFAATEAELRAFESAGREAAVAGSLGDMPLVIVAALRSTPASRTLPPSMSRETANAMLLDAQCQLAHFSTRSRVLLTEKSDHEIPWGDPAIIKNAIDTLGELRAR